MNRSTLFQVTIMCKMWEHPITPQTRYCDHILAFYCRGMGGRIEEVTSDDSLYISILSHFTNFGASEAMKSSEGYLLRHLGNNKVGCTLLKKV